MPRSFFLCPDRVLLNGEVTRFLIRKRKLRQKQIACRLRITEGQLTQYLNNFCRMDSASVVALAQILKVPDPSILILERAESAS